MTDLQKEGSRFTVWLSKRGLDKKPSAKTLSNYEKLFVTLTTTYGLDKDNIEPVLVAEAIRDKDSISDYTKKAYKNALKHYLLFRDVEITDELKKALKPPKKLTTKKKLNPSDLITEDEIKDILKHTRSPMLQAYYAMLWDTGARPSELSRLDIDNVKEDDYGFMVTITKSKTDQGRRQVRLMTDLGIMHVRVWWQIHPRRTDPDAPFFINKEDNRLSVHPVLNNLRNQHNTRLGRGTGNGKRSLNLYLFRKSAATRWLKEKKLSDMQIKARLGHEKQSMMLEQYYAITDQEDQDRAELEAMGIFEDETPDTKTTKTCPRCGVINDIANDNCHRCSMTFGGENIPRMEDELAQMREQMLQMQKILIVLGEKGFDPRTPILTPEEAEKYPQEAAMATYGRHQQLTKRGILGQHYEARTPEQDQAFKEEAQKVVVYRTGSPDPIEREQPKNGKTKKKKPKKTG